jgi:hypothetical protein
MPPSLSRHPFAALTPPRTGPSPSRCCGRPMTPKYPRLLAIFPKRGLTLRRLQCLVEMGPSLSALMRHDACGMFRCASRETVKSVVCARFCAVSSAFGSLTNEFISFSNRGIGRCIKAQRLNADGSPAAPYLPQEGCGMAPFERSIGLLGPELALAFDADDAAVSCGGMFFPMQASLPALLCAVLQPPCNAACSPAAT